ncbi:MAG: transglycosylase domain-containing protein, partial [Chloroflexia bacterium]|nr:transglycosylase domain-containing protein [Chloroflexia bacterium]
LLVVIAVAISAAAGVAGTLAAYRQVNADLPNAAAVAVNTFQTTRIYDRNGVLLQEVDNPDSGWRNFVPLDQVSQDLIDATVASEDATFWTNYGVEPLAIVRGAVINLSGTGTTGASTITQQLVRSLFPDQIGFDVSYTRKGKEALAAWALNRRYSKTDILTMYLSQIYYGNRSYGIEAAAQTFFNKHASELTLAEASLLAGLPQAPTYYNPSIPENFERAKGRQQYVLDQMVVHRYITRAEARAAFNQPLQVQANRSGAIQAAPHFVNYVRQYVVATYGEAALYSGLQITTSIDVNLQQRAEELVREGVRDLESYDRNNAAMVVMVPWSGEVLAMVGSADFGDALISGEVNYALADIQPGSSIKPIAYAAAFEQGWNPGTVIMDTSYRKETPDADEPVYEPKNYSGQYYGAIPVRAALANSFNISAVKALEYAGIQNMLDLAYRMGNREGLQQDPSFYGLALALGGGEVKLLEHTNAYATFANNGVYVPATPIQRIEDSQGNTLFELNAESVALVAERALKAEYAYQITSILTDNQARSLIFSEENLFGRTQSELGRPTAAKSGTTNEWKDIWTMGYTTDVSIGVWVGKSGGSNAGLPEIDGIVGAGPIWRDMIVEMHENPAFAAYLLGPNGQPIGDNFPRPEGIFEGEVCAATGHKASGGEETRRELLVRGEGPELGCGDLSDYERKELTGALEDVQRNGGKYVRGAIENINRYASAAGSRGPSGGSSN